MPYNDYIKTYNINDCNELFNIIEGKDNYPDLRENFIFRGIKKASYELLPKALRLDKKNLILLLMIL